MRSTENLGAFDIKSEIDLWMRTGYIEIKCGSQGAPSRSIGSFRLAFPCSTDIMGVGRWCASDSVAIGDGSVGGRSRFP